MKKLLLVMVVILMFAGVASAGDNNWTPTSLDPNEVLTETANWDVDINWSAGHVPLSTEKISFSIDTVPCLIDSDTLNAVTGQFVIGDNGPGLPAVHDLTIRGALNTYGPTTWTSVGYNRQSTMSVERGGSLTTEHRLGVGMIANTGDATTTSILNVDGGVVDITGNLQVGSVGDLVNLGHIGIVNVNAGLLAATGWEWRDTDGLWSFMDISHGTVIIDGDVTGDGASDVPALVAIGALTAYGEQGDDLTGAEIVYSYDGMETTITATGDPLNRYPAMDAVLPIGTVTLSWDNLPPESLPGYPLPAGVWVDIWYGTNPSTWSQVGWHFINEKSASVSASSNGTYYWRVDSYLNGDPTIMDYDNDPNISAVEGMLMVFHASDDFPPTVDIDTSPTITWKNEPIHLSATIDDDSKSQVDIVWTSDDPNAVFTNIVSASYPMGTVYPVVSTADVTVDYASGQFTVTATVSDSNPLGTVGFDIVQHDCAQDACEAARGLGGALPGDIDVDCAVGGIDFTAIGAKWLDPSYAITEPQPL
ncbi:MAG: hypothetical protein KAJ07_12985 [Planctomycetes bacterium]|nr:hypothetical protein [Planctomycetota bacterium]